jgi:ubiquitin-protein ligase E3 C
MDSVGVFVSHVVGNNGLIWHYRMFNQQELQILLGGVDAPVDLQDLRTHTKYGGLYEDGETTIQAFWKVLDTFDQEQKRGVLRFVTSCSRPPLLWVLFLS